MTRVLYPGSFDPFTNGHLHVIQVSSEAFDEVIVNIGVNSEKVRHFNIDLMKSAMEEIFEEMGLINVKVVIYEGATINLAREMDADFIVRGLRDASDLIQEERNANLNYKHGNIDTIYIRAGEYGNISSSVVRELLKFDIPIDDYVPKRIKELIFENK
ncbi:MAG: pantetheine-phosphate adenylyltransferase [Bacilli bacterium]|nr:pantetheine-phosphate adenylyltransferase [Bacilli bacterium]